MKTLLLLTTLLSACAPTGVYVTKPEPPTQYENQDGWQVYTNPEDIRRILGRR